MCHAWQNRLVLMIAAIFVLLSGGFILGQYQDAGDMPQYMLHVQNMLHGRSWGVLLEKSPVYLPGYSLLLLLPTLVFGMNMWVYGVLNALMWAAFSLIAYWLYRPRLPAMLAFTLFIAVLFAPYVIRFEQAVQPNIFYSLLIGIVLIVNERLLPELEQRSFSIKCAYGFAMLIPAIVRLDTFALYAALLVFYASQRRFFWIWLPCAGVAIVVALDQWLSRYGLCSNITKLVDACIKANAKPTGVRGVWSQIQGMGYMLVSYLDILTHILFPFPHESTDAINIPFGHISRYPLFVTTSLWRIGITLIALIGFLREKRFFTLEKLFFGAHLALFTCFFLRTNIPVRYMLPILPIYVFYLIRGAEWGLKQLQVGLILRQVLITGAILFPLLESAYFERHGAQASNIIYSESMNEVVSWVEEHGALTGIAFFKPLILTMRLDNPTKASSISRYGLPVNYLGAPWQLDQNLRVKGRLIVAPKEVGPNKFDALPALLDNPALRKVYENREYFIFRVEKGVEK